MNNQSRGLFNGGCYCENIIEIVQGGYFMLEFWIWVLMGVVDSLVIGGLGFIWGDDKYRVRFG